jgi:hypothetical protein
MEKNDDHLHESIIRDYYKYHNDNVLPPWPNAKELKISAVGKTKLFVVQ